MKPDIFLYYVQLSDTENFFSMNFTLILNLKWKVPISTVRKKLDTIRSMINKGCWWKKVDREHTYLTSIFSWIQRDYKEYWKHLFFIIKYILRVRAEYLSSSADTGYYSFFYPNLHLIWYSSVGYIQGVSTGTRI